MLLRIAEVCMWITIISAYVCLTIAPFLELSSAPDKEDE